MVSNLSAFGVETSFITGRDCQALHKFVARGERGPRLGALASVYERLGDAVSAGFNGGNVANRPARCCPPKQAPPTAGTQSWVLAALEFLSAEPMPARGFGSTHFTRIQSFPERRQLPRLRNVTSLKRRLV